MRNSIFRLIVTSLIVNVGASFRIHQLDGDATRYVEIEAIHTIDSPLGLQIVHAVVPLSSVSIDFALTSNSVWYIPEQDEWPKLGYLTSFGWFFLDENHYHRVQSRSFAKRAPKNAQLDVTSLLRLAPSTLENVQFIQKGSLGAYVYSDLKAENKETINEQAQLIKTGNLGAYIFSGARYDDDDDDDDDVSHPSSEAAGEEGGENLYWIVAAIGANKSKRPHQKASSASLHTVRLHDSSLLLYSGMPRLVKLRI